LIIGLEAFNGRAATAFRRCEEQSDEAIQSSFVVLDCFATLAMTISFAFFASQLSIGGFSSRFV
jgi:hypothetical protein